MTRTEMLQILSCVPFTLIDPPSEWEDIGFTERPIWVNSKGYGYIMCDDCQRNQAALMLSNSNMSNSHISIH